MEEIISTRDSELKIKTCYFADSQEFGVVFEYPNGEQQVVETFKSALFIMEKHDFWCKFAGVIKEKSNEIKKAS